MATIKALLAVMVLLFVAFASAEDAQPASAVDQAAGFLTSLNPLILIVAGIVLVIASSLAKVIGILLLIIGIILVVLSLL